MPIATIGAVVVQHGDDLEVVFSQDRHYSTSSIQKLLIDPTFVEIDNRLSRQADGLTAIPGMQSFVKVAKH
jgi:hypothetical protein